VIITDDDNFPTDRYVLEGIAAQRGCELRLLPADMDEGVSAEVLAEALDDRTALVSLSHVAYRSGALADMAALTDLVHRSGALTLWDLSHSVGAVPVELDASGAEAPLTSPPMLLGAPTSAASYAIALALREKATTEGCTILSKSAKCMWMTSRCVPALNVIMSSPASRLST